MGNFGETVNDLRNKKLNELKAKAQKVLNQIEIEQKHLANESAEEPKTNVFDLAKVAKAVEQIPAPEVEPVPAESHIILDKTESYSKIPNHIEIPETEIFRMRCERNWLKTQLLTLKAKKEQWGMSKGVSQQSRKRLHANTSAIKQRL